MPFKSFSSDQCRQIEIYGSGLIQAELNRRISPLQDSDGRKVPSGGAPIKVKVASGVGGSEQEGIVRDMKVETYTVTYVDPKREDYMLSIEYNGKPILGSPFSVFFSQGTSTRGLLGMAPPSTFPDLVNHTMPNMPNYSGSVSGAYPGLVVMILGVVSGALDDASLLRMRASLWEVCREYLNSSYIKTNCKLNHPPRNFLMTALAATTSMWTLSQKPLSPSVAAMVAAQALQAHAAQVQAQQPTKKSSDGKIGKADALKRTIQVSNVSPLLTMERLKRLFSFCGTVVESTITSSKNFASIEYSKPKEATATLALKSMDVGGRQLNIEMAVSIPQKSSLLNSLLASSSLPMMMQQAVAMQQMQFQQALLLQQTASMKSATELAAARAAEISNKLKPDGPVDDEKETKEKSRFWFLNEVDIASLPLLVDGKTRTFSTVLFQQLLVLPFLGMGGVGKIEFSESSGRFDLRGDIESSVTESGFIKLPED